MNPRFWKEGLDGSFPNAAMFAYEKGGSAPMPQPTNPLVEARAQMEIEASRAAREEANRRREAKESARELARKENRFNSNLEAATQGARNYGRQQLTSLGIDDTYGLLNAFEAELANARRAVPHLADNVNLDARSIWSSAADQQRGVARRNLGRQFDEFAGTGFERNYFDDTADDAILSSILGEQEYDAQAALDRAIARGQLSETAQPFATKALGQQSKAANARLQDLGGSVLSNYRTSLGTQAGNVRNRINSFDFGDNIDLAGERANLDRAAGDYRGRMEGDILNTVGDTDLFNIDLLLGKALNRGGGAVNTGVAAANPLVAAMEEDPNKRTVGNTGVF